MTDPNSVLSPEMIAIIRNDSREAEARGSLSSAQLQLIHQQKWFHLFVPAEYGGLALSLPEAVKLEESLAYADGSVGWVVTLCAGAAMFIGYFNEDLVDEIFNEPYVCIAGSGQANGSATITNDGFKITGSWPYASGAPHATHFTANCVINDTGQVKSFIFKKDEVTLRANWKYIGLNATAGYSFFVTDLTVPYNRSFEIDPAHARMPHPIYRYPFLQLAEGTIAANISGMCLYFFDLAKTILTNKKSETSRSASVKNTGLHLINSGTIEIASVRKRFYDALDASWSLHIKDDEIPLPFLNAVSDASLQLAQQSRDLVNRLYPYCGMDAARLDTVINQVWRNINTASQHSLLL